MMKSEKVAGCPECGNIDLIRDYEAGELVCEKCGISYSDFMEKQTCTQEATKK